MDDAKKCNRRGCENVGCTRYSKRFGYICEDCYTDLIEWCMNSNVLVFGVIESFMDITHQQWRHDRRKEAKEYVDKEFENHAVIKPCR